MAEILIWVWFGGLAIIMFGMILGAMSRQMLILPLHFKLLRLIEKEQPTVYRTFFFLGPFSSVPFFGIFNHAKFNAYLKTGHPELSPQAESMRQAYKASSDVVWKYHLCFVRLWGVAFLSIVLLVIGLAMFGR